MDSKLAELMNDQINKELFSAYLYLHMSNYYADQGLAGFQNWYKIQAKEEQDHAMLFLEFLQNNGISVELKAVARPDIQFKNFDDPIKTSQKHEKHVTELIHTIYDSAYNAKDYRTMQFLDWFVKEQGEEEKTVDDLLKKYQLFGSDAKALYMLDSELAARVYAAPTLVL